MHNTDRLHVVAALTYVQSEIINPNQKNNRLQPLLVTHVFLKGSRGKVVVACFLQNIGSVVTAAKMTSTLDHSV